MVRPVLVALILAGIAVPCRAANFCTRCLRFVVARIPSRRDPATLSLSGELERNRSELDVELREGDISRADHDAERARLSQIEGEARTRARAEGGTLSALEEKDFIRRIGEGHAGPHCDPQVVAQEVNRLRALLDQKLAGGMITRDQHEVMNNHLAWIDRETRSAATGPDGVLSGDRENQTLRELELARDSIERNFLPADLKR